MGWFISGMGHFGSCSIFGSVRLWIGLLWVFGSKQVVFISDVGLGMDSGCSVWVSGLRSVLPGLVDPFLIPSTEKSEPYVLAC